MNKIIVLAALSLFAWLASAQTAPKATAGAPASSTSPKLSEVQLRGSPQTMFAVLVRDAGLSGGVAAENEDCSYPSEKFVSIPAGTDFGDAVAQIAKFKDKSRWNVKGAVANYFPEGAVPSLLQVRINSFSWDKNGSIREVLDRIRQLPEVTEAASRLGLREAPFEGAAGVTCLRGDCSEKTHQESIFETEKNVSLLEVLNRVAQAHSGIVWNYSEFRCEKGTLFSLGVISE
jgi:hypothetical protein